MAGLPATTKQVRGAVVAFITRAVVVKEGDPVPDFPEVIGTGFFVDSQGVIATNRHVVEALQELPRHPKTNESSAAIWVMAPPSRDEKGALKATFHFVEILKIDYLASFNPGKEPWFGQLIPDLAFVQARIRDVPYLKLSDEYSDYEPGTAVASLGFPFGSKALKPEGRTVLLGPTLRAGIISAIQPIPDAPHGLVLDMMQQGGASGSPVFLQNTPTVVGVIWGVFTGTNFTYAVPSHIAKGALERYLATVGIVAAPRPTLAELAADPNAVQFPTAEVFYPTE